MTIFMDMIIMKFHAFLVYFISEVTRITFYSKHHKIFCESAKKSQLTV